MGRAVPVAACMKCIKEHRLSFSGRLIAWTRMHIHGGDVSTSTSLAFASLIVTSIALVMVEPDPQFFVLLGICVTSAVSIWAQTRLDKRIRLQHEWDEARIKREKQALDDHREFLMKELGRISVMTAKSREDLQTNTHITIEASKRVAKAEETGAALVAIVSNTNNTAHRIEEIIKSPPVLEVFDPGVIE